MTKLIEVEQRSVSGQEKAPREAGRRRLGGTANYIVKRAVFSGDIDDVVADEDIIGLEVFAVRVEEFYEKRHSVERGVKARIRAGDRKVARIVDIDVGVFGIELDFALRESNQETIICKGNPVGKPVRVFSKELVKHGLRIRKLERNFVFVGENHREFCG